MAVVRQKGEIEDYIQEFEMLVGQATELTKEQLMGYFFAGLHPNIRNQIRPYNPKDLLRAMEIERDVGEVLKENRVGERTTNKSRGYQNRYQGSGGVISRVETLKGNTNEPGCLGRKEEPRWNPELEAMI